jgi:diguanylate cyclase (GGDEF)-like protein
MIDIDKFKDLNDAHGHATGDEVLRAVGGAIVSAVREDDVPARYGGEEFVVLLRNPSPEVALEVGERVRVSVATLDLARLGVRAVSVSVGVAVASQADQPIADVIAQADRALYRAKRAGRDRVVAA